MRPASSAAARTSCACSAARFVRSWHVAAISSVEALICSVDAEICAAIAAASSAAVRIAPTSRRNATTMEWTDDRRSPIAAVSVCWVTTVTERSPPATRLAMRPAALTGSARRRSTHPPNPHNAAASASAPAALAQPGGAPAEALHVGNMSAFTGADIYGRFKRLAGYDVFEPIGFDAFGIHSENYALSIGAHPAKLIPQNITTFRRQLRRFGGMFDWRHELSTTDPRYYKWTQWLFLQFFKAGLAFRKRAAVNWCPACKTVLANEQVINGYCERHPDVRVEQRFLEQWFFAITRYAERLLRNLDALDWSESTAAMQRNWIGRSEGAELVFETPGGEAITAFTTRPDTVFGATYMVLAPEHPLVDALTADEQRPVVNAYRRAVQAKDIVSRKVGEKTKTGVFLGSYAPNPATGETNPISIAHYVLMGYRTRAIMAGPSHHERDVEFAQQFKLPIVQVVRLEGQALPIVSEEGVLMNSGQFNGLSCRDGAQRIVQWLAAKGLGRAPGPDRPHHWGISRPRYWGPPSPPHPFAPRGPAGGAEEELPLQLPV